MQRMDGQNERIVAAMFVFTCFQTCWMVLSGQVNEFLQVLWLKSLFRVTIPLTPEKVDKEFDKSRKSSTLLSCSRKNEGRQTGVRTEAVLVSFGM